MQAIIAAAARVLAYKFKDQYEYILTKKLNRVSCMVLKFYELEVAT